MKVEVGKKYNFTFEATVEDAHYIEMVVTRLDGDWVHGYSELQMSQKNPSTGLYEQVIRTYEYAVNVRLVQYICPSDYTTTPIE
jgi:hypothetical protein